MTGDDLISWHKATERVIEDMAAIDQHVTTFTNVHARIDTLRESVTALAVIQRDILAGTLRAMQ